MATAELVGVNKYFGNQRVLTDINLFVKDGEFLTFVGPSGSGKSTLLRVFAGLEPVSDGSVHIGDRDVTNESPKDRNVSMVFQNYALYPHMSVGKNITFGMKVRGESRKKRAESLARAAAMLKLEGLLDRKPRQLSGGQRQRVAMARAIVHEPDLFLMDEPLSNLDAKLRNEVRLSIMQLQEELICTMIYVTHDQIEAMTMADRIVVLDQGRIQQIGTPQELYHKPTNQFTAGFIGTPAMNFIHLEHSGESYHLPCGTELPVPKETIHKLNGFKQLTLGIRPEHIHQTREQLQTAPSVSASTSDNMPVSFSSTITSFEMLGSEFLIHAGMKNGNGEIMYRQSNIGEQPIKGRERTLHFLISYAHFFNGETGERLN